jgi:hypothetical protein
MILQFYSANGLMMRSMKAVAVPHQGETVFFWDIGRFYVTNAEQRFEEALWSETGYEEIWRITIEPE